MDLVRRAWWVELASVVLLAFALRALFLLLYPDPGASADSWEYLMRSKRLATGAVSFLGSSRWHAWQTWTRPPGFYLFLAGLWRLPGPIDAWVTWSHALFSALTAGGLYLAGRELFGRRAGLAAGLLFALSAESIVTFSRVLTEPLFLVLLVPGLAALARASTAPRWRWAAVAGFLFGLAAYVRSAPIVFVPVAALVLLWVHGRSSWRSGWKPAAALVGAMVVTVAPWCVRNSIVHGTAMGMDDMTVVNLLQSWPEEQVVPTHGADFDKRRNYRDYYRRLKGGNADNQLTARSGEIFRRALRRMLTHPAETAAHTVANLERFGGLYRPGFIERTLDEPRPCRRRLLAGLMNGTLLATLALGAIGLVLTVRRPAVWPVLTWFVVNFLAMTIVFHTEPRYRFIILPVAFLLAGAAVARLRPGGAGPEGGAGDRDGQPEAVAR